MLVYIIYQIWRHLADSSLLCALGNKYSSILSVSIHGIIIPVSLIELILHFQVTKSQFTLYRNTSKITLPQHLVRSKGLSSSQWWQQSLSHRLLPSSFHYQVQSILEGQIDVSFLHAWYGGHPSGPVIRTLYLFYESVAWTVYINHTHSHMPSHPLHELHPLYANITC